MDVYDQIRGYWDADAEVYDSVPNHAPSDPAERAAWAAAVARLLPSTPSRVLDCGAGTGFLSLIAARQGHKVTALDLSPRMLERLEASAEREGVEVEVVLGRADQPPEGPWDVIMERHLVWTLPDPVATLSAWRAVAPMGRLVCFEGRWGSADPVERARGAARDLLRRLRKEHDHHAPYGEDVIAQLPLGSGTEPSAVVAAVSAAGWPDPWVERLRDIEWAARVHAPLAERLIGMPARYAVTAG